MTPGIPDETSKVRSPFEAASQLGVSLDALAAVAAHLRIEAEDIEVDPAIRDLLASVASEVLGISQPVGPAERQAIIGMVRAFIYQAEDLISHPGRAAGWHDTNETLLQGLGQVSAGIVRAFDVAGAKHPSLGETLHRSDAVFIDVGTGTGWLAMAVAQTFPALHVVGVDVLAEALTLARRNVGNAGLTERVELRLIDAAKLEPESADVIWLPMPFLPDEVVDDVLRGASAALRSGGWLLPGTFPGPGRSLPERLMTIRTLRSGGRPWTADELCARLQDLGLDEVGEVEREWPLPVRLYAATKP
jgi:ribosomal protein L11 methylase PrmA